jgi:hypothetical protein
MRGFVVAIGEDLFVAGVASLLALAVASITTHVLGRKRSRDAKLRGVSGARSLHARHAT